MSAAPRLKFITALALAALTLTSFLPLKAEARRKFPDLVDTSVSVSDRLSFISRALLGDGSRGLAAAAGAVEASDAAACGWWDWLFGGCEEVGGGESDVPAPSVPPAAEGSATAAVVEPQVQTVIVRQEADGAPVRALLARVDLLEAQLRGFEDRYDSARRESYSARSASRSSAREREQTREEISSSVSGGDVDASFAELSLDEALAVAYGGTGISAAPAYGQLLLGDGLGGYELVATSSLGIASGGGAFATSSADYWYASANRWSTTSADAWLLAATTDALAEGAANRYWSQGRFDAALLATTSAAHLSVGTSSVALALDGFDPAAYLDLAAWYATTTDALAEGASNRYYADSLVAAYIISSSTIPRSPGGAYGDLLSWNGSSWRPLATSSLGISRGSVGQVPYFSGADSTVGTSTIYISSSGKVGIGKTNPLVALDVNGTVSAGDLTVVGVEATSVTAESFRATNSSVPQFAREGSGGAVGFFIDTEVEGSEVMNFSFDNFALTAMSVLRSGNVGIGTTTPSARFAVQGDAIISGTTTVGVIYATSSARVDGRVTANSFMGDGSALTGLDLGNVSAGTLAVSYGGTGLSSAPSYGQVLVGDGLGGYSLVATSSLGIISGGGASVTGTTGQLAYFSGTDTAVGTSTVFLSAAGNLGLGTTSPYAKLSVRGGGTSVTGHAIAVTDSSNSPAFVVSNNGNVGIGGYVPSAHVASAGYRGLWMDSSNSGLVAETASGFRAVNITSNAVRGASNWTQQDATRNSFILGLGYESTGNGLNLYRAAAGAGSTFSTLFSVNESRAFIDGQLGLGSSPDSFAKLTVKTAQSAGASAIWQTFKDTDNITQWGFSELIAGDFNIYEAGVADARLYLKAGGNIGVGLSNPASRVSVSGNLSLGTTFATVAAPTNGLLVEGQVGAGSSPDTFARLTLRSLNVPGTQAIWQTFKDSGGATQWGFSELAAGDFNIYEAGVADARLYLKAGGNIGLGTTTPAAKLSVVGSGLATGRAMVVSNSSGATRFVVQDNGYVGVGSSAPGTVLPNGFNSTNGSLLEVKAVGDNATDAAISLFRGSDYSTGMQIWHDGSGWDSYIDSYYNHNDADLFFRTKTGGTPVAAMTIKGSGNIGVGTTTPMAKLTVSSGAVLSESPSANVGPSAYYSGSGGRKYDLLSCYNCGSAGLGGLEIFDATAGATRAYIAADVNGWQTPSDSRLKENIETLSVLDRIGQVRGVSYVLRGSGVSQIGVIAQEMREVFPEVVSGEEADGRYLGVSYDGVAAISLQGVRELEERLETLADGAGNDEPESFSGRVFAAIGEWLADAGNGLASIFAAEVRTEQLCLTGEDGRVTCLTQADLAEIVGQPALPTGGSGSGSGSGSDSEPEPEPEPPLSGDNLDGGDLGGGTSENGAGNGAGSGGETGGSDAPAEAGDGAGESPAQGESSGGAGASGSGDGGEGAGGDSGGEASAE